MLEYPRWKYALVAIVLLIALVIALPNVYGEQAGLQIERRDGVAMNDTARQQVLELLKQRDVQNVGTYVEAGRLMVRFNAVSEQLKARDAVNESLSDTYRAALAFAPRSPEFLRKLGLKPMPLGLDLRGGLYLLYQVDVNSAVTQLLDSYSQGFRRSLAAANLAFTDINNIASTPGAPVDTVRVTVPVGGDAAAIRNLLKKENADLTFNDLVLADGTVAVDMTMTPAQIRARQDYAIEQTRTTLSTRVNELGVSEPIVQRQGVDRVNVQLPGVQNSAEVKDILGKVATLEFRLEDWQDNAYEAQQRGRAPLGSKLYNYNGTPVLLKRELIATGDQLTNATSSLGDQGAQVNLTFNGRAGDSMLRSTRTSVGRRMAVVYVEKGRKTVDVGGQKVERDFTEEKVINLATIQSVLSNQFRITGLQNHEASELALLMRSGSFVATIIPISERAIGPSLGQENIDKGVNALLIGMAAVFLFMVIYYHAFGIVADLVLLANVVLLAALLTMMRASLTLPGIAGIILTVGIAVDANVLIYERIREELRNGVSPQAAIRAGFDKAFSAIADSNVTALIAGLVLWVAGSGAIRGFAIVLTLGIATSMFTSLLGSRALITLMYGGSRKVTKLSIG